MLAKISLEKRNHEGRRAPENEFDESGKSDEISLRLLTKLHEWIEMTQIGGPQKAEEYGKYDEFVANDKSDKDSSRLLTKLLK